MYRKNAWEKYEDTKEVFAFAEGYKEFLSYSKTERLAVKASVKLLEKAGFKAAEKVTSAKPGDKIYFINKNKKTKTTFMVKTLKG